jgi:hypothetical protein
MTTVAIACTTGAYALLLSGLCGAKVLVAPSASRALSLPILMDRGTAKTMQMTVNDRLVHFHGSAPVEIDNGTTTACKADVPTTACDIATAMPDFGVNRHLPPTSPT